MSFDTLKPVWSHILSFLVPSTPKNLSGWTRAEAVGESEELLATLPEAGAPGTTSRRDIRAGDLAVLMRTSSEFNQLAAHHLYRTVICDSLPLLLAYSSSPRAHPHINSKYELLQRIKTLHLEYSYKGDHPSYSTIFSHPKDHGAVWLAIGLSSAGRRAKAKGVLEAQYVRLALDRCCKMNPKTPFSQLSTLSIGAIFGGQDKLFESLGPKPREMSYDVKRSSTQDLSLSCRVALERLFCRSPILHFCQRGVLGSLCLPPSFAWFDNVTRRHAPTAPHFTFHYGLHCRPLAPIGVAHRTRWVLENRDHHHDILEAFRSTSDAYEFASKQRRELLSRLGNEVHCFPSPKVDLEIYCSGDRPPDQREEYEVGGLTPEAYDRLMASRFDADLERRTTRDYANGMCPSLLKPDGGQANGNTIIWKSSLDTPPCLACGGVLEREVEVGVEIFGEVDTVDAYDV